MISIENILTFENIIAGVNIISLISLGIGWFKKNYVIVDLETWEAAREIIEEYAEMKEQEESTDGGGVGFHLYLNDDIDEEEEQQEE